MYTREWSCPFGATKAIYTAEWAATCKWKERTVTQIASEATQMAEIAQERAAKATERERKFRVESIKVKEMAARALE